MTTLVGLIFYGAAAFGFQAALWYLSEGVMKLAFWKNRRNIARREYRESLRTEA